MAKTDPTASSVSTENNAVLFRKKTAKRAASPLLSVLSGTWPANLPRLFFDTAYEAMAVSKYAIPNDLHHNERSYNMARALDFRHAERRGITESHAVGPRILVTIDTVFQVAVACRSAAIHS